MRTFGLRHIALNVRDPQLTKAFYLKVLKMTVEWEPDPENIYLTSDSHDNLALHKAKELKVGNRVDHIGFFVPESKDVDEWYAHVRACNAKIVNEVKTHRDGARSFYFSDPDGMVIQILFHPPISKRAALSVSL